jgi:hypothetical protein
MSAKKTVAKSALTRAVDAAKAKVVGKSSKKAAKANARRLITDDFTIKVLSKSNPFTADTVQAKNAAKVLASKTVAEAKKKGADSWTVRELVNRKIISVAKAA